MDATLTLNQGRLVVSGDIYFHNVMQIRKQGERLLATAPEQLIFDLAQVGRTDSSILALLIAWLNCGKRLHKRISLYNLPEALLAVVEVYGLRDILPLENMSSS